MTLDDAAAMREAWINTFTEMKKHMQPTKAKNTKHSKRAYGLSLDEDEDEVDEGGKREYMAELPCGQVRNKCSFNACCNTFFQATTAIGAKVAGWNLVKSGYADRLVNFVHI